MNSKFIAATVIALSSLSATATFADTFEVIKPNTMSSTTRAAVMADLAKARANGAVQGSYEIGEFNVASRPAAGINARAAVRAEGIQASRATNFNTDGYATY